MSYVVKVLMNVGGAYFDSHILNSMCYLDFFTMGQLGIAHDSLYHLMNETFSIKLTFYILLVVNI